LPWKLISYEFSLNVRLVAELSIFLLGEDTLRIKAELWMQGCGLTILLMLGIIWPHVSPNHSILYHSILPINHVYWGVAIDVTITCIMTTALLAFFERLLPRADLGKFSFWWAIIGAGIVWRLHVSLVWLELLSVKFFPTRLTFLICAGSGIALWYWKRSLYLRIVDAFRLTLALLGVCIFWILPQLFYLAIRAEPHEESSFVQPVPHAPLPHRRIVWVLFDELSQDQVFDHRQIDVHLPAFDRLRGESTTFTNVAPAGYYTEIVVPSLLWGKRILKEQSSFDGELSVKTNKEWMKFPAAESLFAEARRVGWMTGVAGWYIPYCRTFAAYLNECEWQSSSPLPGDYSPQKSIMWNIFAPVRGYWLRKANRNYDMYSTAVMHASDYNQIMNWSHQLIADEDIQFVFLHLPVPHPGSIYNRRTHALSKEGSYLDNLALADATLSQISQWIAATKSSPLTTLVVCSDHSWRVPYWRSTASWSAEEERASQGKFDPRPVLMVRLAGQDHPDLITQPVPALKEHDLIEDLLSGERTPEQLKAWVGAQAHLPVK
jgi:hypothetical protein